MVTLTGAQTNPQPSPQPVINRPIRSNDLNPTGSRQRPAPTKISQPSKFKTADSINADFLPTASATHPATKPPTMAPMNAKACEEVNKKVYYLEVRTGGRLRKENTYGKQAQYNTIQVIV